jgi:hypothetical protein
MRARPILTVTALTIVSAGVAYYFLRDIALPEKVEITTLPVDTTASLNKGSKPIDAERHEQPEKSVQRQFKLLNDKISVLEARLQDLEATVGGQATKKPVARLSRQNTHNDTQKQKPKIFSEVDFGRWMDDSLDASHTDKDVTQTIMAQAEKSLVNVADTNLDDLRCNDRYCRASFTPETGKQVDVSQVIDATSQFMSSGFTLNEPDGSVKLYFTQSGQSLEELRNEAQKTVSSR